MLLISLQVTYSVLECFRRIDFSSVVTVLPILEALRKVRCVLRGCLRHLIFSLSLPMSLRELVLCIDYRYSSYIFYLLGVLFVICVWKSYICRIQDFTSGHAARWYGLPLPSATVTLRRVTPTCPHIHTLSTCDCVGVEGVVPALMAGVVPFRTGQRLGWVIHPLS